MSNLPLILYSGIFFRGGEIIHCLLTSFTVKNSSNIMLRDFPLNCNDLFSGKKLITLGAALSVLPPVGRTTCAQLTARHTVAISQSSFKNDLFFIRFNKIIGSAKERNFFLLAITSLCIIMLITLFILKTVRM